MIIKADKEITVEQISDIEKESLRLVETVNTTQEEMSEFYIQMLKEDFDETKVHNKSNSLKRATSNIAKALSQTYIINDELNAR